MDCFSGWDGSKRDNFIGIFVHETRLSLDKGGFSIGKAKRKHRPSPPRWWFLETDNCWFCKNRNNCNGCKLLKQQKSCDTRKRDKKLKKEYFKKYE